MKNRSFGSFSPGEEDMSAYSDEQLVMEALDDSHQAFEQLIKQYQYRVMRTIASIIGDEEAVKDIAQETLLSAWSNLSKLKEKQRFGGWVNQIAINFSRRWLRDRRSYQEHKTSFGDMVSLTQEQRYQSDKLRYEIWEAIDELKEDYREVVVLHYISGYSYKEISEMLSVPVSTVRGRLGKARNQLRKEFMDMVTKLQLEIDSTVHKFLKEHAKQEGVSVEGLVIRLIEKYRQDASAPEMITRRISEDRGFYGRVSPNGRHHSYVNWDKGNLAVRDLRTGEKWDVTDEGHWGKDPEFADESVWSPDGKQLAYLWFRGGYWGEKDLRIVGIDGSKPRVLVTNPPKSGMLSPKAWSRDGKHILALFHQKLDKSAEIVFVSVADGSMRVLKSLPPGYHWQAMSLSPDDRYVAYDSPQREDSWDYDIFLVETDGSHEVTLVEHSANDRFPLWTPDGDGIVFVSDRTGSMGIWVLEITDGRPEGHPQLIKQNLNGIRPLGLTEDGSYYYKFMAFDSDIYMASLDPETYEVVTPPAKATQKFEGFNNSPAFSPDGKYLAYISRRPRGSSYFRVLVIHSLETGEERVISQESMEFNTSSRWSPDGRSIFACIPGGHLYQIDIETGTATPVLLSDEYRGISSAFVLFPDGSKIFFTLWSTNNGKTGIRAYDLETKQEWEPDFRLACGESYGHGLALSPDGQQLAFVASCENEWSLQIAPPSGGNAREVLRLPKEKGTSWEGGLIWTPDGRYLLFPSKLKDEATTWLYELWRISVNGGEPMKLGLTIGYIQSQQSFHPDGCRIAFTGPGSGHGGVWAMENFLPTFSK